MQPLEAREIRSCQVLAEELHFGRAARRLNSTQPGLSKLINGLEGRLGVSLFRRTTRMVELTEAGRAFLAEANLALQQLDRAVAVAQRVATGVTGLLRVAYMDFAINGRLPDFIRRFRQHRPSIRLDLLHLPSDLQKQALQQGQIDVGFMLGGIDNEYFSSSLFDVESHVAVLPAESRLAQASRLSLSDLAEEDFVLGAGGSWSAYRGPFLDICERAGFFPRIAQEATTSEGILGLVAAGIGISTYASCVRNVQRRGVAIRELEDVRDEIPIYAAYPRRSRSPALDAFVAFLIAEWDVHKPAQRAATAAPDR
jgi:DNA-binding transcriptional LysR family regulator